MHPRSAPAFLRVLLLALAPLLARAGTPTLRLETTVSAGDVTAFIDQLDILDATTGLPVRNAIPNAGFETSDALASGSYGYRPTGAGWAFDRQAGLAASPSGFGNAAAPQGNRVALLQSTGSGPSSLQQTLPNLAPGLYRVRLLASQRSTAPANQGVRVLVDGLDLGAFVPGSTTAYTTYYSATFVVARPSTSTVFPSLDLLTTDGSTALDVGSYATPTVTDVDGDGLLDLLVGQHSGNVTRFEQPTPNATSFASLGALTTNGRTALNQGALPAPTVTDVDGDGLLDLLVGGYDGYVTRFEQTLANGSVFASQGLLTTDGNTPLDMGQYSIPTVTDVDGDGLLDLLMGSLDGNVRRFEQTAANGNVFASLGPLTTNGSTALDVGSNSAPAVTDVDGDGLLDLLVGNNNGNGTVTRFEQTTVNGGVFASVGELTTNGSTSLNGLYNAFPAVTDVDGDGLLDLLVGNSNGNVRRFEQAPVPTLTALSRAAELPGQAVTITGTGFVSGSSVSFGGVAAASVTYTSPTSLTAVVPVGATPGSSPLTVGSYDVTSPAAGSPAFEVLQVYRNSAASACLTTDPLTLSGTGGAGTWRYLRLPGAGGAVVAAIEDTRNLGTVTAGFTALGTATSAAVRQDAGRRRYLDRNFYLTATNQTFPGSSVRVRFFGLSSELTRLQAVDANATLAGLRASQYSGANENCVLADNSAAGEKRLLAAPATVLAGADWFTAEATVADHFSEFYLTGASTPLPVELTAFTATTVGPTAVRLAWTTASEKNSQQFDVERSLDGATYYKVGRVAAAGSSSAPRRYELLDGQLPPGATLLYYRLRQVDATGTFSYSPVRTVLFTHSITHSVTIFPNPAHGGAAMLTGAVPGAAVTVMDALGRPVAAGTADAAGTVALALPAGLAAGV